MSTFKGLLWGLAVGILGAYLYDKWFAYRAARVRQGSTGDVLAEVTRFFGTPVTEARVPGIASVAAGNALDGRSSGGSGGGCSCSS